jgi:hypothetical protein
MIRGVEIGKKKRNEDNKAKRNEVRETEVVW